MKKNIKNIVATVMSVILLASTTSCGLFGVKPTNHQITFDYNYDNAPADSIVEVAYGTFAEEPTAPTREGYEFQGWFTDEACTQKADFSMAVSADVTYYAKWKQTDVSVYFDLNYEGSTATSQQIAIGSTVSRPASPVREGYYFVAWYTDAECSEGAEFNFDAPVSAETTLYAKWEVDAGDTVTITYMWNYEGAPSEGVYDTMRMQANKKPKLAQAARENYYFKGWYTDPACTQLFNDNQRLNENVVLYARWYEIYTFEAEYVDVSELHGFGYSGDAHGVQMIERDHYQMGASNGYYVGWLYDYGLTLEFNIVSDKAIEGACIAMRISAEFSATGTTTINNDEYTVDINGTPIRYNPIVLTGVTDGSAETKRPFTTHLLSTYVDLKEGNNVIKLIVTNNIKGEGGTMRATAPMVDCLYIYSDTVMAWGEGYPLTDNLIGR